MLPKSLILAIIVGVVASGLIGILFLDLKNTNELVFVKGESLSVLTDKSVYKIGEPITIRIVNSGTIPLEFSDASYGLEIRGLDTMLIYSPISDQQIITLQPHEEATLVWNQIKNDGNKAVQGVYKIYSKATLSDGKKLEDSVVVEILK